MLANLLVASLLAAAPCESLASLKVAGTTITAAETVAAGPFTPPAPPAPAGRGQGGATPAGRGQQPATPAVNLPAHCRVAATLRPSSDSIIDVEIWMPAENWNGNFQAVGNGGWAGVISYPAMALALQEGYATASTDTGHKGGDPTFALGHREKLVDFAYRAAHEMTVVSKAAIKAFYDRGPRLSYWNGCSTGGRQALMEAQRYAEDFDGIIAGAPAYNWTHQHAADIVRGRSSLREKGNFLPPAKIAMLNKAVVDACDAQDGVTDGILGDPRTCRFDPSTLLCRNGGADSCLTSPELEAVRAGYAPAVMKNGTVVFPGLEPGGELGWGTLRGVVQPLATSPEMFRIATYQNPAWDWRTFDLDRDLAAANANVGFINAVDPDLRAFKARGGKLLLYHGWNDAIISPQNTVNYYQSVLSKLGGGQDGWVRLFMMPGTNHCNGGVGPSQANFMAALERWRESGTAPDQITAFRVSPANNRVDMTRPLCPYPQVAQYKKTGSVNDAANFVCKAP